MNAEGWKSQRMLNVSITKSATVRASKGIMAAVHVSLDREGKVLQNSKLTSGKLSDLYQSHKV